MRFCYIIMGVCMTAVMLAICGCFPQSIHPLYTDQDVVFEEKLIGKWSNDGSIWEFSKGDEKEYSLRILEGPGDKEGSYIAHLVKLDNLLFLDIYPGEETLEQLQEFYRIHLLPVHTFAKVETIDEQFKIRFMDAEKVSDLLEENPELLKHERTEDVFVLTDATENLQKFILDHIDEGIFSNDVSKFQHLEPVYTEKQITFDDRLVGMWADKDGDVLDITKHNDLTYNIMMNDGDDEYEFIAQLIKLDKVTLLGVFFNSNLPEDKNDKPGLVPDYFLKIEQIEPNLQFNYIEFGKLKELIDGKITDKNDKEKKPDFDGIRLD